MLDVSERCAAFLRARMPGGWRPALDLVRAVAAGVGDRAPAGVARALDRLLWDKAQAMLTTAQVTAVVNRNARIVRRAPSIGAFVSAYGTLAAAVLLLLPHRLWADLAEDDPHAAWLMLLSEDGGRREAARDAIAADLERCADTLAALPGIAFFLLARETSDCQISLIARDAFWRAMMGR